MKLLTPSSDGDGNWHKDKHDASASGWYGVPDVPGSFVRRSRLVDLLDQSRDLPLVLVSAAAGTGKTSLVADWVALRHDDDSTEWVTFESGDETFWPSVVGALARLGVVAHVRSFPDPGGADRAPLTSLADAVALHASRLTLVLDGYELASMEIGTDLDFLLRHSAGRLQVVMVTRVDPVIPLYRYRLEGSLGEVRMADLAFTDAEAGELLRAAGVRLTDASVRALNARTEGWVAGLRFASASLAAHADPDRAVDDVAGDRGDIALYLMGEVLATQSPEVRDLLLRTSVPETIQPGLAEVLAGPAATATLELLSRMNAFVEPVPEHPDFYRYHPFLRDLLRAELAHEAPDAASLLQRLAAEWFAQDGQLAVSISHYASIDAWAEAASRVVDELAVAELLLDGPDSQLAKAVASIPADLDDSAAAVLRATLALADGDIRRFNEELAEVTLADEPRQDIQARSVAVATAVLRAVRARSSRDPAEAVELAKAAEHALSERERSSRTPSRPELSSLVRASEGIALLRRGEVVEARGVLASEAVAGVGPGFEALRVEALGHLALIACTQDELRRAVALATRAVTIADDARLEPKARPSAAQVALAWVELEQGRLLSASEHARLAQRSEFVLGAPVARTLLAVVRARLHAAAGDVDRALTTVERTSAELVDQGCWLPDLLRLEAARLRLLAEEPSLALLEVEGLELRHPSAVAAVVAQARLAEGDQEAAHEALTLVLAPGSPLRDQVTGWLVEASRQLRLGSPVKARSALARSVTLAAKENLRMPFHEAPAAVVDLLPEVPGSGRDWLRVGPGRGGPMLVQQLTDRELEVLRLLAELLTTEEIAEQLFVSVNTIRTHVRSILRKLGVTRRNAAVRRARELRLLSA